MRLPTPRSRGAQFEERWDDVGPWRSRWGRSTVRVARSGRLSRRRKAIFEPQELLLVELVARHREGERDAGPERSLDDHGCKMRAERRGEGRQRSALHEGIGDHAVEDVE